MWEKVRGQAIAVREIVAATGVGTALLSVLLVAGCGAGDSFRSTEPSGAQSGSPSTATASTAVTLSDLDRAGYEELLSRHRGQVVLVDFWATWCAVCVEGLPHTLELQRRYGDRGWVVVTVAIDDAENRGAAESLLGKSGAVGRHFIAASGAEPQGVKALGVERGTIPAIQVFNRAGQLDRTFGDGDLIPHAEVEQCVAQLLGE